jgi:hypothetical protein
MEYLDPERLEAIDVAAFRAQKPYPWINPMGLLTDRGYERLRVTLPEPAELDEVFGISRSHGQQSHDRLSLEYDKKLAVAEPWHEFVRELNGRAYQRFLGQLYGRSRLWLSCHWHYTPNGCLVSPHCDAKRKLGSHIFYFNTHDDWDPSWGGQTLVLDDEGRFDRKSAPAFEDFKRVTSSETMGNRSFLFARGEKSWHGVREVHCPESAYRKVFIVVVGDWGRTLRRVVAGRLRGENPLRL